MLGHYAACNMSCTLATPVAALYRNGRQHGRHTFGFPSQFLIFFFRICSNEDRPAVLRVGLPSSPAARDAALVDGGGAGNVVRLSLVSVSAGSVSEGLAVTAAARLSSSVRRLMGLGCTGGLLLQSS